MQRLWDFINQREEPQPRPHPLGESSDDDLDNTLNTTATSADSAPTDDSELPSFIQREIFGDRDWFWLTYEPDDEDIDW